MTSRERTLAILLGGFVAVAVIGGVGFLAFWMPLSAKRAEADKLAADIDERNARLGKIRKDMIRAEQAKRQSLPADADVARQEYDAAINKLLRDARVPHSAFTVMPHTADSRATPEIAPKKPAYSRIALKVTLKPVDKATLVDFLQRYYRLNVLHQITKFTVKKLDNAPARPRSPTTSDRADLDVTLVTEAIILDGAEDRRSLQSIPVAFGAIGGGAGFRALHTVSETARGLTQERITDVLASADRDYTMLLGHDPFHGPNPVLPVIVPQEKVKEDTSPFIRLTGMGRNSDGTGTATIEDLAGKMRYEITMTRAKGKLVTTVEKFYFNSKGVWKSYGPGKLLEISEETSATERHFRVVGFDGDETLVLAEAGKVGDPPRLVPEPKGRRPGGGGGPPGGDFMMAPGGDAFAMQPGGGGPPGFGGPPRPRGKTAPGYALVGGVFYVFPQDRIYAWKHGDPLSKAKELPGVEGQKAVQRASADKPDESATVVGSAGRE